MFHAYFCFPCRLVIFTDDVARHSGVFSAHLAPPINESNRCGDSFCGNQNGGIVVENFNYNNVLTRDGISSHRPILTRYFVYKEYLQLHRECKGVLITDSRSRDVNPIVHAPLAALHVLMRVSLITSLTSRAETLSSSQIPSISPGPSPRPSLTCSPSFSPRKTARSVLAPSTGTQSGSASVTAMMCLTT